MRISDWSSDVCSSDLETLLEFEEQVAPINIDLTTGANVAGATSLRANGNICRMGVKMSGDGFKINTEQRARFIADGVPPERMPLVVAGTDVTESQSNTYALDFLDRKSTRLNSSH